MEKKDIAILILNWNGRTLLEQFLPSVVSHSPQADVMVVDNGSSDDSCRWLTEHFPDVRVIQTGENLGFTGAYNFALKQIEHPYSVLLNSDVEVTPDWLLPLKNKLDNNTKVAAVQPKLLDYKDRNKFEYAGAAGGFLDHLGYPFCRGRIFDNIEMDEKQYDEELKVFWATGACVMVRTSVFNEINGFDSRFFAHMEEIDLCWRMQLKGYEIWCCPGSVVYHLGGATLNKSNPHKTFLNFRNNLLMLHKNLPANRKWPVLICRLFLDGIAGLKFLLQGNWKDMLAIIKAHFSFYFSKKIKQSNPIEVELIQSSLVWNYYFKGKKKWSELL